MSDLVEFLLARIAEDEAVARAAAPGPWSYSKVDSVAGGTLYDPMVNIATLFYDPAGERVDPRIRRTVPSREADQTGEHIARHDPARVLAECEAKRRIVERYRACEPHYDEGNRMEARVLDWTMRLLALSCIDHPGWREEWRP